MDDGLQALATLAEAIVTKNKNDFFCMTGTDSSSKGQAAKHWTPDFINAGVCSDKALDNRTNKGMDTVVGQFLAAKVERSVEMTVPTGSGRATLHSKMGRNKQKLYWFEIAITTPNDAGSQSLSGGRTADVAPWMPSVNGASVAASSNSQGGEVQPGAASPVLVEVSVETPSEAPHLVSQHRDGQPDDDAQPDRDAHVVAVSVAPSPPAVISVTQRRREATTCNGERWTCGLMMDLVLPKVHQI